MRRRKEILQKRKVESSANTESILDILSSNIPLTPFHLATTPSTCQRERQSAVFPSLLPVVTLGSTYHGPYPLQPPWASPVQSLVPAYFGAGLQHNVLSNPSFKFLHIHLLTPIPSHFPNFGGFIPECNLVHSKCFRVVFQPLHQTAPQTNRILPPSRSPIPAGLLTSFIHDVPLPA